MQTIVRPRQSKYCLAIVDVLKQKGHASNSDLLHALRASYPELSATTIHRATQRLAERGEIGLAPPDTRGVMRYDTATTPHDHFMCSRCGTLRDADVASQVSRLLEQHLEGCRVSGRLLINGTCKQCR